jgi:hypothetical protein
LETGTLSVGCVTTLRGRAVSISHRLFKVTGHGPFWRFVENRYCALKISPIFIKYDKVIDKVIIDKVIKDIKYDKVVKLTNNKIM